MVLSATRILVVEDQQPEREALSRLLRTRGFQVVAARNVTEATAVSELPIDLVISDLRLGNENGIDLLQFWSKHHPGVPVILVTAYGEVESAVSAMKLGAVDYLTKPLNPERLLILVDRYSVARQQANVKPDANLHDLERLAILSALDRFQGNRTRAAESLGISVRTLQRKLKQWGAGDLEVTDE